MHQMLHKCTFLSLTISSTLLILLLTTCAGAPQAMFNGTPANGEAPLKVTFTNSSSNADTFQWDFGDGSSSTSSNKKDVVSHEYTSSGVFVVKLTLSKKTKPETASATFAVTVMPGALDHIVVSPASATMEVAKSQTFAVSARDQFDNEIPGLSTSFTADGKAGLIDKDGNFSASTKAGQYSAAVKAEVVQGSVTKTSSIDIGLKPGVLDHIVVSPASVTMEVAKSQAFAVSARDQFGNEIPGLSTSFTADGKAGLIDKDGNFSASTKAGQYSAAIKAEVVQGSVNKTSSIDIGLTPGALAKVKVIPDIAQLGIGDTQQFSVEAVDQFGNFLPGVQVTWSAQQSVGTITDKGLFAASAKAGTVSESVKATVSTGKEALEAGASITIRPGAPATLFVSPIKIAADEKQEMRASVADKHGNPVEGLSITWAVLDVNAGSVLSNGKAQTFVAGKVAKTFQNAIQAQVSGLSEKADIAVVPGPLSQVVVGPSPAKIGMGMTQQFVAVGADSFGNRIGDVTFSWAVLGGGGTISSSGLFTAGTSTGTFSNTVKATGILSGVSQSATASVTVEPDRILFQSATLSGTSLTNYQNFIMNADGTNTVKFGSPTAGADCTWSPDGRRVACAGSSGLYVLSDDGANAIKLLTPGKSTIFGGPSWSSDGRRLIFENIPYTVNNGDYTFSYDVWAVDVDGGNLVGLTNTPTIDEYYPKWSPDRSQIVYVRSTSTPVSSYSIWIMNSDGSDNRQLSSPGVFNTFPAYSSDGKDIVFSSTRDGPLEIYLMNPDGSNMRRLTNSTSSVFNAAPSWTPDGRIVYYSNKGGSRKIYVMNRDGSAQAMLSQSTGENLSPLWAPRKAGVEVSTESLIISDTAALAPMAVADVMAIARKAVVRIETNLGVGTGFLISEDGLILTANHVVSDASRIGVTLDNGANYTATVVGRDLIRDLALIRIGASGLAFLRIGDVGQVRLGQQVIVIGFPLGTASVTVTSGIMSSLVADAGRNLTDIQTDTAVNQGNSGGPMLDLQGNVVGLVTSGYSPEVAEKVNFAVSANSILLYLSRLKAGQTIFT